MRVMSALVGESKLSRQSLSAKRPFHRGLNQENRKPDLTENRAVAHMQKAFPRKAAARNRQSLPTQDEAVTPVERACSSRRVRANGAVKT